MDVTLAGGKHNLTDIAACIGLGQLPHLQAFTARRRELARRYFARFDRALGCELPLEDYAQCNWHMFQVAAARTGQRNAFIAAMRTAGIGVGVHYPAMHLFSLFRKLGTGPEIFRTPNASAAASSVCRCSRPCRMPTSIV